MESCKTESLKDDNRTYRYCGLSLKWTKLFALIGVWMSMGMAHSLTSATLPDLREKVGVTVEEAGRAFAFGGIGGIIGALLGSLADRYNSKANLMLAILVIAGASDCILKPLCNNLWTFSIVCFIEGVTWTCVNAVGNPMVLSLWGEKSGAPMQALHFGYPLGSMIGPLVAYPFVSKSTDTDISTMSPYTTTDSNLYNSSALPVTEETVITESTIEIAYAVVGLFGVCNGLLFILFQFSCDSGHQSDTSFIKPKVTSSWRQVFSPLQWGGGDAVFGGVMVTLVMLFYFVNVASIKASGLYYTSYAIEGPLEFTNQEGTLYSFAFNLAGTLGRASAMFAAVVMPVTHLFPVVVCGQALGSVTILIWGLDNKLGFVTTSCVYSYFSFPVWPLGYAWADIYIFLFAIVIGLADVTSKVSDTMFGYLLAYLYEYTVKESIFYNSVCASVLLIGVAIVMMLFGKRHGNKYNRMGNNDLPSAEVLSKNESTKL